MAAGKPRSEPSWVTASRFQDSYRKRQQRQVNRRRAKETKAKKDKRLETPALPQEIVRDLAQEQVAVYLPSEVHAALLMHCREFGIRPHTFIKRALELARLSRGGFG